MTPFIDKSCRIKIFDCFVKTVMRNEYRDAAAEKKRIQNREAKPDLMNVPEIEDVYPSEHFILDNEKYPCLIASDWLYDAMLELPKIGSLRNVGVVKSICKQVQTAAYQCSNHGISATGGFISHGYSFFRNRVSFVN